MNKKIAIMQPYFLPYIGYFQLIKSVDEFVIYDNIKYTKKGWINRNRIFFEGKDKLITLPIKKDSDFLDVCDRSLSDTWISTKKDLINQIKVSYGKAPNFTEGLEITQQIISNDSTNLFTFLYESIKIINSYLGIETKIIVSSEVEIDHKLKSQDKVIAICKKLGASQYINAIGGVSLYSKEDFLKNEIKLNFIKTDNFSYPQFDYEYVPYLSILDVIMFNDVSKVKDFLNKYSFV